MNIMFGYAVLVYVALGIVALLLIPLPGEGETSETTEISGETVETGKETELGNRET